MRCTLCRDRTNPRSLRQVTKGRAGSRTLAKDLSVAFRPSGIRHSRRYASLGAAASNTVALRLSVRGCGGIGIRTRLDSGGDLGNGTLAGSNPTARILILKRGLL